MDYWKECIEEAFEDAGIDATQDQIVSVASFVDGAHENYGMSMGHDCIPNPLEAEICKLKEDFEKERNGLERLNTVYRQSVATRRRVDLHNVYIDGDTVMVNDFR